MDATIVLGVIGCDCHAVGNTILSQFFLEEGYRVINLKTLVSQQEFVNAAIESDADAIFISSLYGHAELDCAGFRDLCNQYGLKDIILYIGGNLVVGKVSFESVEKQFKELGFDRVFDNECDLEEVNKLFKKDLNKKLFN